MKNKEKKVIILDKLSSPFIAQAIIILKESAPECEDSLLKEAEEIVSGYFPQQKNNRPQKRLGFLAGGVSVAAFVTLAAILVKIF